jgi:hypothetical protein
MHVAVFSTIRSVIVSKHSELTKRQVRDRYERFASSVSRIAPPPSHRQEVGSSSHCRIAPPPSSDDSSVEMWEVPPPHLRHWATPPRPPQVTTTSALTSER